MDSLPFPSLLAPNPEPERLEGRQADLQLLSSWQALPKDTRKQPVTSYSFAPSFLDLPWTQCCLFGKSFKKCFPISIIQAMLKLCRCSKTTCSENAPWRLVYTAGSGSAGRRMQRCDFSAALCWLRSTCSDITGQAPAPRSQWKENPKLA